MLGSDEFNFHHQYLLMCCKIVLTLDKTENKTRTGWESAVYSRLLLLKLVKQIGGTIYWPFLATNKALGLDGVEYHIGRGVALYKCLLGCKIQPVDSYVAVCLVLAMDVYYDRSY